MADFKIIIREANNYTGELGAVYNNFAILTAEVDWYPGSYSPLNDSGTAIRNYFVGRGWTVTSYRVEPLSNGLDNAVTIYMTFGLSARTQAKLNAAYNAFTDYIVTKGRLLSSGIDWAGRDLNKPAIAPTKTDDKSDPATKPPKPDWYAQLDESLKKYGLSVPTVAAGLLVLIVLQARD